MMIVGEILARISLDSSRLLSGLHSSQSAMGSFSSAVGSLTSKIEGKLAASFNKLALASSAAFSAAVGWGIKVNADAERARAGFESLLGSVDKAKSMMADLSKFAAETPFETKGVNHAARAFLNAGVAADSILPALNAVGNAVAIAGGGDEELNGVVVAFSQMINKGKIMSQEMYQLAERGIDGWGMLEEAMGKPRAQLMKMAEEGKLYANTTVPLMMKAMNEKYAGAIEAQGKTLYGMYSTLKDNVGMMLGAMTSGLADSLKDVMPPVLEMVNKLTDLVKANGLKGAFLNLIPDDMFAPVSAIISKVEDRLTSFLDWIKGNSDGVVNVIQAMVTRFIPIYDQYIGVVDDVVALIQAIWEKHGKEIITVLTALWDTAVSIFEFSVKVIRAVIQAFTALVEGDFSKLGKVVGDIFQAAWDLLKKIVVSAVGVIWAVIKTNFIAIVTSFTSLYKSTVGYFSKIYDAIVDWAGNTLDKIIAFGLNLWEKGKEIFGELKTIVLEQFDLILVDFSEWVLELGTRLLDLGPKLFEAGKNAFAELKSAISEQFDLILVGIDTFVDNALEKIKSFFRKMNEGGDSNEGGGSNQGGTKTEEPVFSYSSMIEAYKALSAEFRKHSIYNKGVTINGGGGGETAEETKKGKSDKKEKTSADVIADLDAELRGIDALAEANARNGIEYDIAAEKAGAYKKAIEDIAKLPKNKIKALDVERADLGYGIYSKKVKADIEALNKAESDHQAFLDGIALKQEYLNGLRQLGDISELEYLEENRKLTQEKFRAEEKYLEKRIAEDKKLFKDTANLESNLAALKSNYRREEEITNTEIALATAREDDEALDALKRYNDELRESRKLREEILALEMDDYEKALFDIDKEAEAKLADKRNDPAEVEAWRQAKIKKLNEVRLDEEREMQQSYLSGILERKKQEDDLVREATDLFLTEEERKIAGIMRRKDELLKAGFDSLNIQKWVNAQIESLEREKNTKLKESWASVTAQIINGTTTFKSIMQRMWGEMVDSMVRKMFKLEEKANDLTGNIFNRFWDVIFGAMTSGSGSAGAAQGAKGTVTMGGGLARIPKFHTGGVVPGAGEILALVRGGETIRTPKQEAALSASGATHINITLNPSFQSLDPAQNQKMFMQQMPMLENVIIRTIKDTARGRSAVRGVAR